LQTNSKAGFEIADSIRLKAITPAADDIAPFLL